ncbi:MAG: DNA mismatch repair protein MutS, partial [Bacteroidota bacterium]
SNHWKLITGSNMGGKSTFLRTLGLNVIQAMAGLPVCAKKMSLPILQVYTSMRTQDSLHENTSSFFAELKRLRTIIEAVEEHETDKPGILFLLDEILKGTNSMDRHTGGKALILQMIKAGGAGLVATHDLELGILESEHPDAIENWCFEVAIDEGKLDFDYKLKRGVSKSFNATILMREMGIKV